MEEKAPRRSTAEDGGADDDDHDKRRGAAGGGRPAGRARGAPRRRQRRRRARGVGVKNACIVSLQLFETGAPLETPEGEHKRRRPLLLAGAALPHHVVAAVDY